MNPTRSSPAVAGRRVALLLIAAVLAGCAPQVEPYRYLELEPVSGLELQFAGPLDRPAVWFAGDVPQRYLLQRADYAVILANDPPSVLPGLTVALAASSAPALSLRPSPTQWPKSEAGNVCPSYDPLPGGVEIEFGWSADCLNPALERHIAFDVLGPAGEVIGKERLEFVLKSRGWYLLQDAL